MRRKQRPSRAAEPDYVDDVPMSTVLSELRSENRRLRKNIALSRQVQSAMQERIDAMEGTIEKAQRRKLQRVGPNGSKGPGASAQHRWKICQTKEDIPQRKEMISHLCVG
tara:strand:+ start:296 stop:625 length:330 start_codon:yes stop_codon:yes gene_type:complete